MSTDHIVTLLISERDKLSRAIEALGGPAPAKSAPTLAPLGNEDIAESVSSPKRRTFSAAQRRRQAEKMKAFWAAKRKTEGKPAKTTAAAAPAKRHPMTAARKRALSLKMKAAWARRKKQAKA